MHGSRKCGCLQILVMEATDEYFLEETPGPWQKYYDEHGGKCWWWQASGRWFYE